MPNTAPGTERLAGGVREDAAPAAKARPAARWRRWAGVGIFLLVIVVLFDAYLHLSKTYPENSDEANILLMANDMLHGNVLLHNWSVSDVPFITTELPQIALLVWMFGLHLNTAHIAAAVTYTLVVAVAMLLAKGKARGWPAVARMALALGIMLAPQPGVGIFVVVFSVGHIGTALPVMLTWLVLDRLGRKWYVPLIVAILLGWALIADPLVLVVAILPLLAVCLVRMVSALVIGAGKGGGMRGLRAAALDRWFEVWLAAAAGIGYVIAWGAGQFITSHDGYHQQAVPYEFNWPQLFMQSRIVVHGLLEMFGAYFVPWVDTYIQWPIAQQPMSGLDQAIALTHLVGVIFAVWGACAIARRFFFRDADIVSQLLLAGIVANIAAYVPSTLAHHTALNVREIAPVLPFAAVLAGRMIGDRLVRGPVWTIRVPGFLRLPRVGKRGGTGEGQAGRTVQQALAGGPQSLADGALADGALADGPAALANGVAGPPNGEATSRGRRRRPTGSPRRTVRLRLVAIPLVALFGWYSYGLFQQADTPAAPEPLTNVVAFLEAHHLTYGLGGYWDSSVITVETGGAVTIRAVTPACLQPYPWESKSDWYDPTQHVANFVLLSNVTGYFTKFAAAGSGLYVLNVWSYQPPYNKLPVPQSYVSPLYKGYRWPANLYLGVTYQSVPGSKKPLPLWDYSARVYPFNLLTALPELRQTMNSPPHWLLEYLNGQPPTAC
jgi:hypothetical protein